MLFSVRSMKCAACLVAGALVLMLGASVMAADTAVPVAQKKRGRYADRVTAAYSTVKWYIEAVSGGNRDQAGRLDFACQYGMVAATEKGLHAFPVDDDPAYGTCWQAMTAAHDRAVTTRDEGMATIWPGKGSLVFLDEDLTRYAPSFFVMDRLGQSPPGTGIEIEMLDHVLLPAASFRLRPKDPVVSAPATLIRTRVRYRDPLTSPITYAPDAYKFTNPVQRPRQALKSATVQWVVLTGLKKLGFAGDMAVLNLPVATAEEPGGPIPFVTEPGGYLRDSGEWWQPDDTPGLLLAAVGRASQFPGLPERVSMLNRVLLIDPLQPDALTLLSRDLYDVLLASAAELHAVPIGQRDLASTFNELYWDIYAQTTRLELSLDMTMGGVDKPTPADYLYRMIPAMEKLAKVRPQDLGNRLRLGIAYRWNNDQMAAIRTHEALVDAVPPNQDALKARALLELAWSRIARVSWNRTFEDPSIVQAYHEAEEAEKLTADPHTKFLAEYTMAYSLLFTPKRDNAQILAKLTQAHDNYMAVPGATPQSWRYLLDNDNLKGVLEADPQFKPLLATSEAPKAQGAEEKRSAAAGELRPPAFAR